MVTLTMITVIKRLLTNNPKGRPKHRKCVRNIQVQTLKTQIDEFETITDSLPAVL
jgi:hypothetical protein